ncbi:MAG: nucleotide exchange factor GrpE [Syntrophales bacterium]
MVKKVKMDTTELREGPPQGGAENADPPPEEITTAREEELTGKIQELEKKSAENYDKYVRAVAEFDNYRKRAVREKADAIKYGNENLLRDILPLVDNLDRAMDHASNSDDFEAFRQGLKMLHEQLMCCLKKHGVEMIDTAEKDFDPNVHEAMLQVESDKHEAMKIVNEFERGYLLNGRLLRPAKVSVCRRSNKEDQQNCAEDN